MQDIDPWAGGWRTAVEVVVMLVFVGVTTLAPLAAARGRKGSAGGEAEGGKRGYVLASGVSTLAMTLSITRGSLGVRTFLGFPAELAYRGSGMFETVYGMALAFPLVAWLLVPLYLSMPHASLYHYLEERFGGAAGGGRSVRRLAGAVFVWRNVLQLAVTVYAGGVALAAALRLSAAAAAALVCLAAAVPTLRGNLTTAVRTDAIQTVSMVVVSLVFVAQATWRAGGPLHVYQECRDAGRLTFFRFTGDVRTRVDTVSATLGQLAASASIFGCQQQFATRYMSLGSARRVTRTLLLAALAVLALFTLGWVVGAAVFAVYARCDPLALGVTAAPDDLLPHYVRHELGAVPGVNGVFLAMLLNSALSVLMSNVISLATVTWEDFVSALPACRGASERDQLRAIRAIALVYCVVICALSLGVGAAGGAAEAAALGNAAGGGALLGVFATAALVPGAPPRLVLAAAAAAALLPAALAGARLATHERAADMLPTTTAGCVNGSVPLVIDRSVPLGALLANASVPWGREAGGAGDGGWWWRLVQAMGSVSYMWYAVGAAAGVVALCAAGSALCPGARTPPHLLHPLVPRLAARCPALQRRIAPAATPAAHTTTTPADPKLSLD